MREFICKLNYIISLGSAVPKEKKHCNDATILKLGQIDSDHLAALSLDLTHTESEKSCLEKSQVWNPDFTASSLSSLSPDQTRRLFGVTK